MGRPRATTASAAARSRRANPKPNLKRSFLSSFAPAATATRKRTGSGSSPSLPTSPTDLRFVSSPGSSAFPKAAPKSRSSKRTARTKPAARSPLASPRPATRLPVAAAALSPTASATVSSVGDLRSAAASQMEALKRRLDALHSRAHTDLDASLSRASKRFKTQNQACQQLIDEVDMEDKKMYDVIKENTEMIKAKYKQIMAEAQSSTSRVCKETIPEMTKSVEKAIDSLRNRYNISMPS